jgi:hypothetical protein
MGHRANDVFFVGLSSFLEGVDFLSRLQPVDEDEVYQLKKDLCLLKQGGILFVRGRSPESASLRKSH